MTKLFIVMTKTKYIKCKEWQEEELHKYKQGKALTFFCAFQKAINEYTNEGLIVTVEL